MIEDKELAQLFKEESTEHLTRLDDGLLHLEKNSTDQALLEEVFREAHSLKGAARMLGLSKIETAAHGLESILNTARKGDEPLTPDVIERMTSVLGNLRKLVQEALTGASPANVENVVENAETDVPQATIDIPTLKISHQPPVIHNQPTAPQSSCVVTSSVAAASVSNIGEPFHIETVRVETRKLDDLLTLAGELSVIQGRAQHRLALMDEILELWAQQEHSRKKFGFLLRAAEITDKQGEALQQMLHANDEALSLLESRIKCARDAFYEDGTRLETTTNTLEERIHAIRLLPLSTIFALFPRMVRDLAVQQNKEVELVVEGGEINVDKRVLEQMKDPLMHLLRNAIDHGIEPPAEREHKGKPRCGTVRLHARRENNNVLLEVRDDGDGLDIDSIRRVALQRKLLDEATLATMTTAQLQQLIFLPGFSTSTFVTELSGRGVGLDVVRVNVEHLKGDIRIETEPQHGTVMLLRLPLGLATTRLLLFSVGDYCYGLPMDFVHTSRRLREEDIFTLEGCPAFELDGQPVIAPRLADLLSIKNNSGENHGNETVCIVIQVGDERIGLRVDELLDAEEVLAKPMSAPLQRVRNVSGLAILGDGEICAVLNPADLLRSARKLAIMPGSNKSARLASLVKPCILLVEDTVLVRVMEKRILENAGYEVVAAVDGVEALNALGSRQFDAVVSDITMPNMDGLTLTARIRHDQRYRDLPIILVTSLSSVADKQRGMEVGANAYIPKPSFDQHVLLDILQRLIVS